MMGQNNFAGLHSSFSILENLEKPTMELAGLTVSHKTALFRLSGLSGGEAYMFASATEYIDCLVTMHGVQMRRGTAQEEEQLRQCLPLDRANVIRPQDILIMGCDEGTFAICAKAIRVHQDTSIVEKFTQELHSSSA